MGAGRSAGETRSEPTPTAALSRYDRATATFGTSHPGGTGPSASWGSCPGPLRAPSHGAPTHSRCLPVPTNSQA